jgi:hypothetical protein
MAKKCDILLEYLPWRDLDTRQAQLVKRGLTPFYVRSFARGQGHMEECFTSLSKARKRWRALRQGRVVDEMTLYKDSRSNPIATYRAK